jgi:predicted ATPase
MPNRQSTFLSGIVENLNTRNSFPIRSSTKYILSSSRHVANMHQSNSFRDSNRDKLFGRDQQLKILLDCYHRMKVNQKLEIILIKGASGSGKSSLVQAFTTHLPSDVFCVQGKFDQLHSHAPYSALVTASDQLCRKILRNPNSGHIRDRIRSMLGPDINLLGNLIPRLIEMTTDDEAIHGIHQKDEIMGKSFTRFRLLFRAFLRSVASPENPLIFFLDDLQWADIASLEVLKSLVSDGMLLNAIVVCAFREGEMSDELLRKYYLTEGSVMDDDSFSSNSTSEVRNANITNVVLDCLDISNLNELISFKLGMDVICTESLSQLIWKKTSGNPFYALNFLDMLHRNSLIVHDINKTWIWDESQVLHMTNVADNLASILESKVQNLSEQVRSILQMASFIGYEFPSSILVTIVYEEQDTLATEFSFERQSKQVIQEWITSALKVAVDEGFLEKTPQMDNYKFAHDKIQEVLYETLMPEEIERQLLHQRIGTLIWDSVQDKEKAQINDWFVFLAADNLNRAANLMDYSGDRFYLVELNLTAAKRMIQKSAFLVASEYLRVAVNTLDLSTCWNERYDLSLDLFNTAANVENIIGCYSRCEKLVGSIHEHAKHLHHRFSAFCIEMDALVMQGSVKESILLGLRVLRQLGNKFPRRINFLVVVKELLAVKMIQGRRKLQDLSSIGETSDERISISLSIMKAVAINAFLLGGDYKETFACVCLRMFRITMQYGLSKMDSPVAIVGWGSLNAVLGRFDVSREAEKLSFDLADKYNLDSLRGLLIIFNYLFNHFWREKLDSDSRDEFFRAYQLATSYGHIRMAQFGFIAWIDTAIYIDDNLSDVHLRARTVVSEMRELESKSCLVILLPIWQVVSLSLLMDVMSL